MSTNENQSDNLSADQVRLLSHVENVERDVGGDPGAAQDGSAGADAGPQLNAADENKAILTVLVEMLKPAMPFLGECYPPETIERIAYAYTAVEEKHGWNVRQYLSVEAQLAIVAIPPTIQAIVLGKAYFAERARRAKEKVINPEEADNGGQQ